MRNETLKLTLLLVALFLLFQLSFAQNRPVTGRVTDQQGNSVAGATVTVRGTRNATQTDTSGTFTINAPANATLVFSSVGYTNAEVSIGGRTTVDATMAT